MKKKGIIGHLVIKEVLFIFIVLIQQSCYNRQNDFEVNDIKSVRFLFLPKGYEFIAPLTEAKDVMSQPSIIDTTIVDKVFMNDYVNLINGLTQCDESYIYDFRIVSIINYKDSTKREVCFGEKSDILIDGILMNNNDRLFSFLDEKLYTKENWKKIYGMQFKEYKLNSYLLSKDFDNDFMTAYKYIENEDYSLFGLYVASKFDSLMNVRYKK